MRMSLLDLENYFHEFVLEEVRLMDFQMLDEETFWKVHRLIQRCSSVVDEKMRLSLCLGGRIDSTYFAEPSEIGSFLKVNELDQKFLALRRQLSFDKERGPALPVVVEGNTITEVFWDELAQQIHRKSIRFFYKNTIAFQTDLDLRLVSPFSVMGEGIVQYDPLRASAVFPVEKMQIHSAQNWLEVWEGKTLFLVLTSSKGCVYAIGMKEGHIITPPEEYFYRWDGYQRSRTEITDIQLKSILQQVERDKHSWKVKREENYLLKICDALKMK